MTEHALKTWPSFFDAIRKRKKTFEVRQNDRDFRVGDRLNLMEWNPKDERYTGQTLQCEVLYMLDGGRFGVAPEYCVMAIKVKSENLS